MGRIITIIALVLAVIGAIFLFAGIGGNVAMLLIVAAVILTIIGQLTS